MVAPPGVTVGVQMTVTQINHISALAFNIFVSTVAKKNVCQLTILRFSDFNFPVNEVI